MKEKITELWDLLSCNKRKVNFSEHSWRNPELSAAFQKWMTTFCIQKRLTPSLLLWTHLVLFLNPVIVGFSCWFCCFLVLHFSFKETSYCRGSWARDNSISTKDIPVHSRGFSSGYRVGRTQPSHQRASQHFSGSHCQFCISQGVGGVSFSLLTSCLLSFQLDFCALCQLFPHFPSFWLLLHLDEWLPVLAFCQTFCLWRKMRGSLLLLYSAELTKRVISCCISWLSFR